MTSELPPSADPLSAWMQHLERAHALAHAAARRIGDDLEPNAYLKPAATKIEGALGAIYDACDGRADRPSAMGAAHSRLWDAAILVARGGLPAALGDLREACGQLVAAEQRFPRVALAEQEYGPLIAGGDLPAFHTLLRASIVPTLPAPPLPEAEVLIPVIELPTATTFEELDALAETTRRMAEQRIAALMPVEPPPPPVLPTFKRPEEELPPGFAVAPAKAISEEGFLRYWARECVDDIGSLGLQRAPLAGDDWREILSLERRLGTAFDALVALGPVAIAHVEPLANDSPAPDATRMFATAFVGGQLEGRDVLASAERVLHRFGPGDPAIAAAFASAMKLARNPFVPNLLRTLCASEVPGCRILGVEVLAYRGWLTTEELSKLADDEDPKVLALALPALAAVRHPDLARALARALSHTDLALQEAALDAMVLAAHAGAAEAARSAALGALGDRALVRLALVGDENDARFLLTRAQASPTPAAIEALGWCGLVAGIPFLVHVLETAEDDDAKLAAGSALDRLLGAKLLDKIEVPPEDLEAFDLPNPDPDAKPPRPSLEELVSDPRDRADAGSPDKLEVPSVDPARWREYWTAHEAEIKPSLRLRRGQPYSRSVTLFELDGLPLGFVDRCRLTLELAAQTGRWTFFSPSDLVAVQCAGLKAWEPLVQAAGGSPGSWSRPVGWR